MHYVLIDDYRSQYWTSPRWGRGTVEQVRILLRRFIPMINPLRMVVGCRMERLEIHRARIQLVLFLEKEKG